MSYPPDPYGDPRPLHPGPEPVFPFTEAQAALTAIQALLDQLMALGHTRTSAASEMLATSSGQSITNFTSRNQSLSTELANSWGQRGAALQMDAQWVRDAMTAAHTLHDQWQSQKTAYDQWVTDNAGPEPHQVPR